MQRFFGLILAFCLGGCFTPAVPSQEAARSYQDINEFLEAELGRPSEIENGVAYDYRLTGFSHLTAAFLMPMQSLKNFCEGKGNQFRNVLDEDGNPIVGDRKKIVIVASGLPAERAEFYPTRAMKSFFSSFVPNFDQLESGTGSITIEPQKYRLMEEAANAQQKGALGTFECRNTNSLEWTVSLVPKATTNTLGDISVFLTVDPS